MPTLTDIAHVLLKLVHWLVALWPLWAVACALGGFAGLLHVTALKLRTLRVRIHLQREYRQQRRIVATDTQRRALRAIVGGRRVH